MKNGVLTKSKRELFSENMRRDIAFLVIFSFFAAIMLMSDLSVNKFIGFFSICIVLLSIYYRDILRYSPEYIRHRKYLLLLGVLLVGTIFGARLADYFISSLSQVLGYISPETAMYILPIPAGALLVTLLFDFHSALFFSFITSLLAGLWLAEATAPLYFFIGSLTASFGVIRCKKRSDILKAGLLVSSINVLIVTVLLLISKELFTGGAVSPLIAAALSGVIVAAIVSLALPLLEYFFKHTTDISLLELLDLNQPLMRNLLIAAPGTYHHSIIVGNLVEAAAEAVDVNPLLARVTAYYHDIGKVKMPEYFVENQAGSVNKHDKLSPHMSSMILISHVKEGIELAKQFKLPKMVMDIIEQHHGTNLITYFYQKAKSDTGEDPPEEEYRYPGPRPQSRVAALVMLADAVEAASRVLKDPTSSRIEALVDKMVNHVFLDGQLNECELTLKDISLIKKHFTFVLTGIFHRRIDYPGFDFDVEKKPGSREGSGDGGGDKGQTEKSKSRSAKTA
ncbi:MAG: HDIG domain-containing protein [Nitrospirota bacterium]|nr:MAG: HDIG domain-containing protein [Nitrospirota bacterium]